jgi:hypothetical protein
MSSGDSGWLTSQKTGTATEAADSADSATSAASVASAENGTSAVKGDRNPSFTPSAGASGGAASGGAVSAAAAPSTTSTAQTGTGSSYSGSSYSGSGAPRSGTAYAPPSGYSRPAPAGGTGASPSGNGSSSSNGFSSGAASAVGGAAAGLANSVTSAWQRRGSARGMQTRKAPKRQATKRQAMLTLARVEPWSVMKFSFVASVVAFIILFVAVAVLYMVLSALGVFDSLQHTVSSITSSQSSTGTNISHWFSASLILGYTAMLGALNIVLITAMSTVGSVIYNLIAKTIGGIEVTLRETD